MVPSQRIDVTQCTVKRPLDFKHSSITVSSGASSMYCGTLVVKMGLAISYAECFHNNSEIIKTPMSKLTATQSYQKTITESGLPGQNDLTNFLLGKQKIKCHLCTFPFYL